MDETEFETEAERTLGVMMDTLDEVVGDVADVDLEGGILTIVLDDGRQFVLNKHAPNRQLWLSSPVSGASHFDFANGAWTSTRGGAALHEIIANELSEITDQQINAADLK
jgi:frataxin